MALYNKVRKFEIAAPSESSKEKSLHGIAFATLVSYLEEFREDQQNVAEFKLADLAKMYTAKLQELGLSSSSKINTSRLKERLLRVFPDLGAHMQGRDVLLFFNHSIREAIRRACEQDFDSEALHLARAAKIVQRDMFRMPSNFKGTFPLDCQEMCVPDSLKALVDMIYGRPSIKKKDAEDNSSQKACLIIAQL